MGWGCARDTTLGVRGGPSRCRRGLSLCTASDWVPQNTCTCMRANTCVDTCMEQMAVARVARPWSPKGLPASDSDLRLSLGEGEGEEEGVRVTQRGPAQPVGHVEQEQGGRAAPGHPSISSGSSHGHWLTTTWQGGAPARWWAAAAPPARGPRTRGLQRKSREVARDVGSHQVWGDISVSAAGTSAPPPPPASLPHIPGPHEPPERTARAGLYPHNNSAHPNADPPPLLHLTPIPAPSAPFRGTHPPGPMSADTTSTRDSLSPRPASSRVVNAAGVSTVRLSFRAARGAGRVGRKEQMRQHGVRGSVAGSRR